jgi:hypothetical protein
MAGLKEKYADKKKKKKEMTDSEKMPHGMYRVTEMYSSKVRKFKKKELASKEFDYIANSGDSFKKAFRSIRNKYGDDAKFKWRGKTYSTKLKK